MNESIGTRAQGLALVVRKSTDSLRAGELIAQFARTIEREMIERIATLAESKADSIKEQTALDVGAQIALDGFAAAIRALADEKDDAP